MLPIRVNEVEAIAKLDELSRTKEFAEAAGKAIARPVTSTVNMIVHPVETITGFPTAWGGSSTGSSSGASACTRPPPRPTRAAASGPRRPRKRVGMATITALGFEKERRDLAKSLGVDPYTTNPVLVREAHQRGVGRLLRAHGRPDGHVHPRAVLHGHVGRDHHQQQHLRHAGGRPRQRRHRHLHGDGGLQAAGAGARAEPAVLRSASSPTSPSTSGGSRGSRGAMRW